MWTNLIASIQPWWKVLHLAGLLIGLSLVVISLLAAAKHGRNQHGGIGAIVFGLLAGIFLLNLWGLLDAVSYSAFRTASAHSLLSYSGGGIGSASAPMIRFALMVVQLVGLYGVIKGGVLLYRSGSDPRAFGSAMTHIVGGVFAVNILTLLHVLGASVGGGFQGAITRIF